jgi:hypothetical protein
MVRQTSESPAGDADMLTLYANAVEQRGYPSVYGWFYWMHDDRVNIAKHRDATAQALLDGAKGLRHRCNTEPGFAKSALRDIKNSSRP